MQEKSESIFDCLTMNLKGTFYSQVNQISKIIRMSPKEFEKLQTVYDDLQEMFDNIFEGCQVQPFGSVVMGLALVNSDVDCFIAHCNEEPAVCIARTMAFLRHNRVPFRNAHAITKPKIPIITLFHPETGRHCDISFSGPIAVHVGRLVSSLLAMHPQALPMAVLIKCWAKVHHLTGKSLPSNALIILVIFFLQHKRILPSVASLQENVTIAITEGWNTAFADVSHRCDTKASLYDLMGEFFLYYRNYNFGDSVVSPYLGRSVVRQRLLDMADLPVEFKTYRDKAIADGSQLIPSEGLPMCIQDFFVHNRNIAVAVKPQLAHRIMMHIRFAAEIYEKRSKTSFLKHILQKRQLTVTVQPAASSNYAGNARRHARRSRYKARVFKTPDRRRQLLLLFKK